MAMTARTRDPAPRHAVDRRARSGLSLLCLGILASVTMLAGTSAALPRELPRQTDPTTTTTLAPPVTTPPTVAPTTVAPNVASPTTTAPKKAVPAPATAASGQITPIVECSYFDAQTKITSTVWGYQNRGPATSVPLGDGNRFDNPPAPKGATPGDAGQPTDFKAGRDKNVFIVNAVGPSTWTLTGITATAPGNDCKTNPVPIVSEGLGGLVSLAVVTSVMALVLFWRMRRPRRS